MVSSSNARSTHSSNICSQTSKRYVTSVRLDAAQHRALARLAAADHRSVSFLIYRAIDLYLDAVPDVPDVAVEALRQTSRRHFEADLELELEYPAPPPRRPSAKDLEPFAPEPFVLLEARISALLADHGLLPEQP